ncbi:hypothetical protein WMY93_007719 [Mugilogobius chulae]|uniref:Uncharacterized protein n=1 Tax=Mugilogobius chulae TaxID=88201 RepID=A0AAW0PSD2_9GOBI
MAAPWKQEATTTNPAAAIQHPAKQGKCKVSRAFRKREGLVTKRHKRNTQRGQHEIPSTKSPPAWNVGTSLVLGARRFQCHVTQPGMPEVDAELEDVVGGSEVRGGFGAGRQVCSANPQLARAKTCEASAPRRPSIIQKCSVSSLSNVLKE